MMEKVDFIIINSDYVHISTLDMWLLTKVPSDNDLSISYVNDIYGRPYINKTRGEVYTNMDLANKERS